MAHENNPLDPAVVTVGSIQGGTKANIIPDEVNLLLTVRSYKEEVRQRLLSAIERIAKAEAAGANAPKEPTVRILGTGIATYNDPALMTRIVRVLSLRLGKSNVRELPPLMASDDFALYGQAGVPAVMFMVGAIEPKKFDQAKASGTTLPGAHSSEFAPEREPTIRTGVSAVTYVALDLLGKEGNRTQGRSSHGNTASCRTNCCVRDRSENVEPRATGRSTFADRPGRHSSDSRRLLQEAHP